MTEPTTKELLTAWEFVSADDCDELCKVGCDLADRLEALEERIKLMDSSLKHYRQLSTAHHKNLTSHKITLAAVEEMLEHYCNKIDCSTCKAISLIAKQKDNS